MKALQLPSIAKLAIAAIALTSFSSILRADSPAGDDGRDFRFFHRIALTSGTAAPIGSSAQAAIVVRDESTEKADLFVLSGVPAGDYTVSAVTLSGTVPVEFPVTVSGSSDTVVSGTALPVDLDLLDIATFTIKDSLGADVFMGDLLGLNLIEGADHVSGKIHVNKKDIDLINTSVKSHLVINARIQRDEPRAMFQLQLAGLPASTSVGVDVNGTSLGQFTTDKHGRLTLKRTPGKGSSKGHGKNPWPESLDVFSVRTITVVDQLLVPYIEVNLRD